MEYVRGWLLVHIPRTGHIWTLRSVLALGFWLWTASMDATWARQDATEIESGAITYAELHRIRSRDDSFHPRTPLPPPPSFPFSSSASSASSWRKRISWMDSSKRYLEYICRQFSLSNNSFRCNRKTRIFGVYQRCRSRRVCLDSSYAIVQIYGSERSDEGDQSRSTVLFWRRGHGDEGSPASLEPGRRQDFWSQESSREMVCLLRLLPISNWFSFSLGQLIKIIRESQMEFVVDSLIQFTSSKDEELRDIAGLGPFHSRMRFTYHSTYKFFTSIENDHIRIAAGWSHCTHGMCKAHSQTSLARIECMR